VSTTAERILDAAELLFARNGVEATSLRSITAAAGANAAAIHYHFGSQEALLEAVVTRRIAPLNQERLKQLEALEAAAGDGPLPIEPLLEAFLAPVVAIREELGERALYLGGLMASLRIQEARSVRESLGAQLAGVKVRFARAACRGRDGLSFEDALERLDYCAGALGHTLMTHAFAPSAEPPADFPERIGRLIGFLAAGFLAPSLAAATVGSSAPDPRSTRRGVPR
jgi:AcrR family transcriptional regulator